MVAVSLNPDVAGLSPLLIEEISLFWGVYREAGGQYVAGNMPAEEIDRVRIASVQALAVAEATTIKRWAQSGGTQIIRAEITRLTFGLDSYS
jgi:hypothetical protein